MRILTPAAQAAIDSGLVVMGLLLEMDLSTPLYLNPTRLNLVVDGRTYLGTAGLGNISTIKDTGSEQARLSFELSGVPSDAIALALGERVQGKDARILLAIFHAETGALLDKKQRWAGWTDVMSIQDGPTAATIQVTAEGATLDLLRPSGYLYSHSDTQLLAPGDMCCAYVNDQVEQKIIWPSVEFFKT